MSIQFGKWNFDGSAVDVNDLKGICLPLVKEFPDALGSCCKGEMGMLHMAYSLTRFCRDGELPHVSPSELVVTWDGRLDNRDELIRALRGDLSGNPGDPQIVAAAYEKWKKHAFARLIGDWAISIWDPRDRSLVLARDFIGARPLFYYIEKDHATWCTDLAGLVLCAGKPLHLEEEYFAGCLASCPAAHLTPYTEIRSVPPASFVRLQNGTESVVQYWSFDPEKIIAYRSDSEYEEHFRTVFRQSVRRRLLSHTPVTAELSGGLDSSSIVCIADEVMSTGSVDAPRLDTLSYFDDSEPSWNEKPYFSKVERRRGRTGCHIDISSVPLLGEFDQAGLQVTPFSDAHSTETAGKLAAFLKSNKSRVLLSGFGGDEVAGGVPTPIPELADLLRSFRLGALSRQLKAWALSRRQPWFKLLRETTQSFVSRSPAGSAWRLHFAPWIEADFLRRHGEVFAGYESRWTIFGARPSFQENIATLNAVRRQLGCFAHAPDPYYEKRYPYLDRDLLEFLFAIPRDQLVRPGQRRSLVRRALAGIVPDEVLNRRRKAFFSRGPIEALTREPITMALLGRALPIIDENRFRDCTQAALHGREIPVTTALRTVILERWLKHLVQRGIIRLHMPVDLGIAGSNTMPVPQRCE
jgi:asparagine synthase (glutamine-hydrolysing)